jgi:hypothetical protein
MEGKERRCAEECVAAGSVYSGMRDEGGRERDRGEHESIGRGAQRTWHKGEGEKGRDESR